SRGLRGSQPFSPSGASGFSRLLPSHLNRCAKVNHKSITASPSGKHAFSRASQNESGAPPFVARSSAVTAPLANAASDLGKRVRTPLFRGGPLGQVAPVSQAAG